MKAMGLHVGITNRYMHAHIDIYMFYGHYIITDCSNIWLFLCIEGPSYGRPYTESPTIWQGPLCGILGSILGPLIFVDLHSRLQPVLPKALNKEQSLKHKGFLIMVLSIVLYQGLWKALDPKGIQKHDPFGLLSGVLSCFCYALLRCRYGRYMAFGTRHLRPPTNGAKRALGRVAWAVWITISTRSTIYFRP